MSNSFCICIYSLFRAIFVWPWNEHTRTKQNNKRKEIERFDWFIERIQTGMAFGWLRKRSGEIKTFMPDNFPEISWYFALTSYCNTIGQSNDVCYNYCNDILSRWSRYLFSLLCESYNKYIAHIVKS